MIISNSGKTIFNGYNVTATTNYVYNSSGGTGAEDGWVNARYDYNVLGICVATLNATSVTYRIEGRTTTYTRPISIANASLNSADTIDTKVNITDHFNEIRVGIRVNNSATPNNVYCGLSQSETK